MTSEAQRRGKQNRRKGHDFEREVARDLRKIFGQARRVPQYQKDHDSGDVSCPIIHPECKVGKAPNIRKALEQAMETCPAGKWAVAVTRRTRKKALVTMRYEDFLDLIGAYWGAQGG